MRIEHRAKVLFRRTVTLATRKSQDLHATPGLLDGRAAKNNGIERKQLEMSSATGLLEKLSDTQSRMVNEPIGERRGKKYKRFRFDPHPVLLPW